MTDLTIIVDAIQKYGRSFIITSNELRDNKEVILTAVEKDGSSLQFASENLRNDKEIVLTAVKNNGSSLEIASLNLRNDKEVVLAAVENFWPALKFASQELQLDKDVQNCVTQYLRDVVDELNYLEHRDSKFIPDEFSDDYNQQYNDLSNQINKLLRSKNCIHLKDEQDFMLKILLILYDCRSDFNIVFQLASEKLLQSKEFFLDLLNEGWAYIDFEGMNEIRHYFPSTFWLDGDCVLAVLNHSHLDDPFNYASEELKSNRDFVLMAVNIKGGVLKYVSTEFKSDREIVISAIKNNSSAFQFASPLLQGDKEIINLKGKEERENELPF
jgi:CxxC motif-containing protein